MALVDLSHPLTTGMPVYPGDPSVRVSPALSVAADGVAVAELTLGSHTGTHLDAPAHSVVGGRTIDQVPLDRCVGDACLLTFSEVHAGEQLGVARLTVPLPDVLPQTVCITTGWDQFWGSTQMGEHPSLDVDFVAELWSRGARVLGVDTLSPDPTPAAERLPVHDFWLGRDGLIIENLTGLKSLARQLQPYVVFQLCVTPLAITRGDGSPVRAVAMLTELEPGA